MPNTIPSDNPIRCPEQDLLQRAPTAKGFADQLRLLDASEGIVVAVVGEWGAGKTSFVNLVHGYLAEDEVPVVSFNPWMFSGAQQLVDSFFVEIGAELKLKPGLEEIAEGIQDYGDDLSGLAWVPVLGPWVAGSWRLARFFSQMAKRRRKGLAGRRQRLEVALANLSRPIVVVLDDVDRLSTEEIRDVFKLVRLTASFPNIIYLLAFDRKRVENALAEQGVPGREYLEKIIQLVVDLPVNPPELVRKYTLEAIHDAVQDTGVDVHLNNERWPDVYFEIIDPLIRHMRDVRRYSAAIRGTVKEVGDQIELADLLALEAMRVFMPHVFALLSQSVKGLTTVSPARGDRQDEPPSLGSSIEGLVEESGEHAEVMRSLVERVFPAAQRHLGGSHFGNGWRSRWLREGRVAHEELLRLYLERLAPPGLDAFRRAHRAWELFDKADDLDSFLRSFDGEVLRDIIERLEEFEEDYQPEQVVPATTVLLNLIPILPQQKRGMFDFGPTMVVGRVTYRLLRSLPDPEDVARAVRRILPRLDGLFLKSELLKQVGHHENAGHKLVSREEADSLERSWRDEVRSKEPRELSQERELLRVLWMANNERTGEEPKLLIPDVPEVTLAILSDSVSEVLSQAMGSRAVRRSKRLPWDTLLELFGSEDELRFRVERLENGGLDVDRDLLELVHKYLEGWRPDRVAGG